MNWRIILEFLRVLIVICIVYLFCYRQRSVAGMVNQGGAGMSEERLMNEAEDYARESTPIESHVPYLCARSRVKQAYLAGAEPREKKIKELEKENAKLKDNFKIAKDNEYEYSSLLTRAKELIKNIIRVTWGEGWSYSLDWKVKAEQFLKEVNE